MKKSSATGGRFLYRPSVQAPQQRPEPPPRVLRGVPVGRLAPGLDEPAPQKRQLVDVDLLDRHRRIGPLGVRLDEPLQAAADAEGSPDAARRDGEVVGRIAEAGLGPVDDARTARLGERRNQELLPQQVAVEQAGGRVGREVCLAPVPRRAQLRPVGPGGEVLECGAGMRPPRVMTRHHVGEGGRLESMASGGHLGDHRPRCGPGTHGLAAHCDPPAGHGALDLRDPVIDRHRPEHDRQAERRAGLRQTSQQSLLAARVIPGIPERIVPREPDDQPRRPPLPLALHDEDPRAQPLAEVPDAAHRDRPRTPRRQDRGHRQRRPRLPAAARPPRHSRPQREVSKTSSSVVAVSTRSDHRSSSGSSAAPTRSTTSADSAPNFNWS